jgi:hypothetical protein
MAAEQRKTIFLGNAYLVRQELRVYSPITDEFAVWTGQPATVTIATDAAGTSPVAGLSALVMAESSATPGVYYRVLTPTEVANLAALAGQTVYQITVAGSASEMRAVLPLLVATPRYV